MIRRSLASALILLLASPVAADDYVVRDGNGIPLTMRAKTLPGGQLAPMSVPTDPVSGNPCSAANPCPLPAGAATSAAQATGNATLASILSALLTSIPVDIIGGSIPLPSGAATSAAQSSANSTLASILSTLASILSSVTSVNVVGGNPVGPGNPLWTALSINSAPVGPLNPLWGQIAVGGFPASPINPVPVQPSYGNQPVSQNNPIPTTPGGTTWTNCTVLTVVTGGTSVVASAADGTRKRYKIENPVSAATEGIAAAENLFVDFGQNASTSSGNSVELQPGGADVDVTTQSINVNAATSGHTFVCKVLK
jgi:hypothetical protein